MFLRLSPELIQLIFSYLDSKSKLALELVCHSLRNLLNAEFTEKIPTQRYFKLAVADVGITKKSIKLTKLNDSGIRSIVITQQTDCLSRKKLFSNLACAKLNLEFSSINADFFTKIVATGNIKRLNVVNVNLSAFTDSHLLVLEKCRNLTELRVERCSHTTCISDVSLLPVIKNGKIEHFAIDSCNIVTKSTLKHLAIFCAKSLKTAQFANCKQIEDVGVSDMITKLKCDASAQPLFELTANKCNVTLKTVKDLLAERDFVCVLKRRSSFKGDKLLVVSALNCFVCVVAD